MVGELVRYWMTLPQPFECFWKRLLLDGAIGVPRVPRKDKLVAIAARSVIGCMRLTTFTEL